MPDFCDRMGLRRLGTRVGWMLCTGLALGLGLWSCAPKAEQRAATPPPRPIFSGPDYLHGTIGSITRINGGEPELVSNYGLVAGLPGTGSADIPPYLRQRFLNEARRQGVRNPLQWLQRDDTALVRVRGLVPPGAVKGDRFDLLVEALPQTQTTSLAGGRLWTTDLAVGGANPRGLDRHPVAMGRGPIYVNPLAPDPEETGMPERLQLLGVVLSGGVVTVDRRLELVLNYPSWDMARIVADRINERFGHEKASEFFNTAVPKNYQIIELNIPARYAGRAAELVELIQHLYYQRGQNFEIEKARELASVLVHDPEQAHHVMLAWHALGKRALPVIREYYQHANIQVRLTALESGARLEDKGAAAYLEPLAQSQDPVIRHRVAKIFSYLPSSVVGARVLGALVDDEDRAVRLRAYESMSAIGDSRIERFLFGNEHDFKFEMDLVPAKKPLIYVKHDGIPRIVIFNPRLSLRTPALARLWDNRLIMKADEPSSTLEVFYQPPGELKGKIYRIQPLIAEIAGFIAHKPTVDYPAPGLDLNYSHVVDVLHKLVHAKLVDAELEIEESSLVAMVERYEQTQYGAMRPEASDAPAGIEVGDFVPLDPTLRPGYLHTEDELRGLEEEPTVVPTEQGTPGERGWRRLEAGTRPESRGE